MSRTPQNQGTRRGLVRRMAGCVAALVALAAPIAAAADADPNAYETMQDYIVSGDGTRLHAWIFRPANIPAGQPTPVLLEVGPYTGSLYMAASTSDVSPKPPHILAEGRAFERGYTVVVAQLRGFGASGGCPDLGGPGEQADVRAAVTWAAQQPWSNGRVGMTGISYPGWTQIMAAADPPEGLAALAPAAAPTDLYGLLYTDGVPHVGFREVFAAVYLGISAVPPGPAEGFDNLPESLGSQAREPGCGTDGLAPTLLHHDRGHGFYADRDFRERAHRNWSAIPTFLTQGFADFNVRPSQAMAVLPGEGDDDKVWVGQWRHHLPVESVSGKAGWIDELMSFLDRHVRADGPGGPPVARTATVQEADGRWREEAAWPPKDGSAHAIPIRPGAYLDRMGSQGDPYEISPYSADGHGIRSDQPMFEAGVGAWTFTPPLPHDAHLAGRPSVHVDVDFAEPGPVTIVALLYDIDPSGRATLVSRGAHLAPSGGNYAITLEPQDWRLRRGHRIGVLLAGTDDTWYLSTNSLAEVHVVGGTTLLPLLEFHRDRFIEGGPSQVVQQRRRFEVGDAVIEANTVDAPPPPAQSSSDCWQPGRGPCPKQGSDVPTSHRHIPPEQRPSPPHAGATGSRPALPDRDRELTADLGPSEAGPSSPNAMAAIPELPADPHPPLATLLVASLGLGGGLWLMVPSGGRTRFDVAEAASPRQR